MIHNHENTNTNLANVVKISVRHLFLFQGFARFVEEIMKREFRSEIAESSVREGLQWTTGHKRSHNLFIVDEVLQGNEWPIRWKVVFVVATVPASVYRFQFGYTLLEGEFRFNRRRPILNGKRIAFQVGWMNRMVCKMKGSIKTRYENHV